MSAFRTALLGGLLATVALTVFQPTLSEPLAADGPWAFVAVDRDTGPDAISVIDLPTRAVRAALELTCPSTGGDCKPFGLALSPAGDRLYVSNSQADSVSVIDLATLQVTATWLLRTPNDPRTRTPRELVVSPDGARLYVSNQAAGTVSVLDTATGSVLAEPPVGLSPRGLDFLPDGRVVVVSQGNDNTPGAVTVLGPAAVNFRVVLSRTLDLGLRPVAVKAVGGLINKIFVVEEGATNQVGEFDFDLQPAPNPIAVGHGPVGIVYDDRTWRLYVACGTDQDIWEIRLADGTSGRLSTQFQPNPPTPFNGVAFYPGPDPQQAQLVIVGGSPNQGSQIALAGFVTRSSPETAASIPADPGKTSMPWGVVVYTKSSGPPPTPAPPAAGCADPARRCLFLPVVVR